MNYTTKAIYHQGTFVPETARDLPEGAQFELVVQGPLAVSPAITEAAAMVEKIVAACQGPLVVSPAITDPDERARTLKRVVAQMLQNPLPPTAPRYTREELHERR